MDGIFLLDGTFVFMSYVISVRYELTASSTHRAGYWVTISNGQPGGREVFAGPSLDIRQFNRTRDTEAMIERAGAFA